MSWSSPKQHRVESIKVNQGLNLDYNLNGCSGDLSLEEKPAKKRKRSTKLRLAA